jgi:hypothetical protein
MRSRALRFACLALACAPGIAGAWYNDGHEKAALLAVKCVREQLPAFFSRRAALIAHCSHDPDLFKDRSPPQSREQKAPEHYIDLELLDGTALPDTRRRYLKLLTRKKLDPTKVGMLPYAVAEWTDRRTVAFAQHRRWPKNAHIQTKCCVYAGILAHYAGGASRLFEVARSGETVWAMLIADDTSDSLRHSICREPRYSEDYLAPLLSRMRKPIAARATALESLP